MDNLVTKEIIQKSEQFKSENNCCVCMSNKADVYFENCHHVCICTECCQRISPFNTNDLNISNRIISERELPIHVSQRAMEIFQNSSHITKAYCCIYGGMGCCWYIRKNGTLIEGFFMHSDNYGQYGPESDDTPILEQFKNGYINVTNSDVNVV